MSKRKAKAVKAAAYDGPRPATKSAGGKWKLLPQIRPLLPPRALWTGYRSPFVGGGADFYGLATTVRPAVIADANARLIDTYKAIRDCVGDVIDELRTLPYDERVYYTIRDRFNRERDAPLYERAAWLIYLNRTCVNGLYRENLDGEFNVSFGSYTNPTICDAANLIKCSAALRGVDIRYSDFEDTLADVRAGEMCFIDPPYVPLPGKQSFVAYIAPRFTSVTGSTLEQLRGAKVTDHERLARVLRKVDAAGAYFVAFNSDTAEARKLYGEWDVSEVKAVRSINSDGAGRGEVTELVFRNSKRWTT